MSASQKSNQYIIGGSVILAALLIVGGIFLSKNETNNEPANVLTDPDSGIKIGAITADDHIKGSPDADIVVIEFSDFECPFCKTFHAVMDEIVAENERVAWVFRQFPLTQLHSKARIEAHATECAAELGGNDGFWAYADRLFEITPSNNGLDLALLPEIAEQVGLDRTAFEECQDSERHMDAIATDITDARNARGTGTPHNVLLTKRGDAFALPGGLAKEQMSLVIDTILAGVDENQSYEYIIGELGKLFN